MQNFDKLEQFVKDHIKLIILDAEGRSDASERAGKFLVASSILMSALKDLEISMTKTKTLQEATFAASLEGQDGTITEKKAKVGLNPEYVGAREEMEGCEARRTWLKNFIRIFDNAHLLARLYLREG